jgi:hypothetical protein
VFNAGTANLVLTDCAVSGNSAHGGGGGIKNVGTAMVSNSTFTSNSASGAGAIDNDGTAAVSDSTFTSNSGEDGGGLANYGTASLTDCTVSGNTDEYDAGGVANFGGANLALTGCTVSVTRKTKSNKDLRPIGLSFVEGPCVRAPRAHVVLRCDRREHRLERPPKEKSRADGPMVGRTVM